MRILALFFALVVMVIGIALWAIAPDRLFALVPYVLTPAGLYAIGALRAAMGIALILVGPRSRAPRALRVIGIIVLVAGLATPVFGVERSRAVADWAITYGTTVPQIAGLLLFAFGGFIVFAASKRGSPG